MPHKELLSPLFDITSISSLWNKKSMEQEMSFCKMGYNRDKEDLEQELILAFFGLNMVQK